jgi:hypothetical protein
MDSEVQSAVGTDAADKKLLIPVKPGRNFTCSCSYFDQLDSGNRFSNLTYSSTHFRGYRLPFHYGENTQIVTAQVFDSRLAARSPTPYALARLVRKQSAAFTLMPKRRC